MKNHIIKTAPIIIFVLSLLTSCTHKTQNFSIIPITTLNMTDTTLWHGKMILTQTQNYLLRGVDDDGNISQRIDEYVEKVCQSKTKSDIIFSFYKESDNTNLKSIVDNPRVIDRYSNDHDLLFYYYYNNGHLTKEVFKNGSIISPAGRL